MSTSVTPTPPAASAATTSPTVDATPAPVATPAVAQAPAATIFHSASLYVGDLLPEITEGVLWELFNKVGPVASIRVCRDTVTRRSFGYAYVNFHEMSDAERALDTMQFTEVKSPSSAANKACRIMWSQRDPSLRKSGVGNMYVKNLAKTVDNKSLFDIFSVFGNILSCKVAVSDTGESKGYGYVHYENAAAAAQSLVELNGALIDEVEVVVKPFVPASERAGQAEWTDIYVKQFPVTYEEEHLNALFAPFGSIASLYIKKDEEGKSLWAIINFTEHGSAEKAIAELHTKEIDDVTAATGITFELYVSKAQKKSERSREIKSKVDAITYEKHSKWNGMNCFVKNLDESITDEILKETFEKCGVITSAKVEPYKGYGYVCFSSPEEATRAITELHGKMLRSKPLFVGLHQSKDQRNQFLAATFANGMKTFNQVGFGGQPMPYGMQNMYLPPGGQFQGGRGPVGPQTGFQGNFQPGFAPGRGQMGGRGQQGNYGGIQPQQQQGGYGQPMPYGMQMGGPGLRRGMPPGNNQNNMQNMNNNQGGRRPMGPGGNAGPRLDMNGGQGNRRQPMQGMPPMMPAPGSQGQRNAAPANARFDQRRLPPQQMMMMPPQQQVQPMPVLPDNNAPLDDQALAAADPEEQKVMIGERLYPLIYAHQDKLAGKITGMLLEMDNAELLNLIESPDALLSKIEEALNVLNAHNVGLSTAE